MTYMEKEKKREKRKLIVKTFVLSFFSIIFLIVFSIVVFLGPTLLRRYIIFKEIKELDRDCKKEFREMLNDSCKNYYDDDYYEFDFNVK